MKFPEDTLKKLEQFGEVTNVSTDSCTRCHVKKEGVRVEIRLPWEAEDPKDCKYIFDFFVRNENGGMEKRQSGYMYLDAAQLITAIGEMIRDNPPVPKNQPKAPLVLRFIDNGSQPDTKFVRETRWPGDNSIVRAAATKPQIHRICQMRIVNLDGTMIDQNVFAPTKNNLMFHIECTNSLGATFDILTNGEEFMPVDRYKQFKDGKKRIVKNTSPKASVDLTMMNRDDQEMIKYAIECFMTEQVSDESS